jgi:peroxiredoxin
MKRSSIPPVLALLAALATCSAPAAELSGQQRAEAAGHGILGSPAPRMVVKTVDGATIDLGALYGKKAVYLKFWATWCTPCREQMPHFERVYERAGPDLAVIAVNVGFNDSLLEIRRYRKRLGITMPIVFDADGRVGAAFNLRVTPQHVVIGRDGTIQYVGHLADQRLDAALVAARTLGAGTAQRPAGGRSELREVRRTTVGDVVPDLSVRTIDGANFEFLRRDGAGKTVLVFLSPWCESYLATTRPAVSAACRAAREQVSALEERTGVRWLGIASGLWATADDVQAYRATHHLRLPLTVDESGQLFQAFGVNNTPTIIVVDQSNVVVQRIEAAGLATLAQAL